MKEEELQAYVLQLEEYEKSMNVLAAQHELMKKSLEEHLKVLETLKNFSALGEEREILIPIGAGVFIPGSSKNMNRVIINIGTNIFIEAETAKATEMVEKRINGIKEAIEKILSQMSAIQREAGKITALLREEEAKRLGGNA